MNDIFLDLLDQFVIVYLDDILVFSNSLEELRIHVKEVLLRLRKYQLYAKAFKCDFEKTHIEFFGFLVSDQGFKMDLKKVEAILNWPPPANRKVVQRFVGSANFYRRFIKDFSAIISLLLTFLVIKLKMFWSSIAQQAFEHLKKLLSSYFGVLSFCQTLYP